MSEIDKTQNVSDDVIYKFDNVDAVAYADDVMQRVAGSADPLRVPPAMRGALGSILLQLQQTMRNRYALITTDLPIEFRKNPKQGLIGAFGLAASSTVEILV